MNHVPHILVVDDDSEIRQMLADYLQRNGLRVSQADGGRAMRALMDTHAVDLVVLDVMMPGEDGLSLCRNLRAGKHRAVPVVLLTARDDETDRIIGLELGADDYITKPFSPRELVARVRAIMRRVSVPAGQRQDDLNYDGMKINLPTRRVALDGEEVDLTYTEFELLVTLATSPGRVFARLDLLEQLQDEAYAGYERTVDAHVKNLRRKLTAAGGGAAAASVVTVPGVGYKMEAPRA